jgi:hypothetical protein
MLVELAATRGTEATMFNNLSPNMKAAIFTAIFGVVVGVAGYFLIDVNFSEMLKTKDKERMAIEDLLKDPHCSKRIIIGSGNTVTGVIECPKL